MRSARLALLLVGLAHSDFALCKCVDRFYEVTGVVVDGDGTPTSGAMVGVSWIERNHPEGPALGLSDERGRYSIRLRFHTYSRGSIFVGDVCKGQLKEVSVAASTRIARSYSEQVRVGNSLIIKVEALKLEAAGYAETIDPWAEAK